MGTPALSRIGRAPVETSSDPIAHHKRKYFPSPATDEAIRDAYRKQRQGEREALRGLSRKIAWSRNAVCKRGAELGVTRAKELPWGAAEEDLLERFGYC